MPYKLLLADDSVTIQRVIELTFADEDIKVIAVGDGQQAVDRIVADRPDVVLADVGMPQRDGYEVAAFVKDRPDLAHIPVLLLTGAFEPVDEERARAVRCNGVLAKPFEPQLLISRVRELLVGVTPSEDVVRPPSAPPLPVASQAPDVVPAVPVAPAAAPVHAAPFVNETPAPSLVVAPPLPVAPEVPLAMAPFGDRLSPVDLHFSDDEDESLPVPTLDSALGDRSPSPERFDLDAAALNPQAVGNNEGGLDDYFDRLDAAFAHLTGQTPGRDELPGIGSSARRHNLAPSAEDPWFSQSATSAEGIPRSPEPFAEPFPEPVLTDALSQAVLTERAAAIPAEPAVQIPVADAFASLLAAEREHGPRVVHDSAPSVGAAVVLPGTAVTDALLDDLARRIADRLTETDLKRIVGDVVLAMAEKLVREEIERIKASVK